MVQNVLRVVILFDTKRSFSILLLRFKLCLAMQRDHRMRGSKTPSSFPLLEQASLELTDANRRS